MAGMYTTGIQSIMSGNIDLINDDIVALLVDTDVYTVDLDADETQADIPTAAVLAEKTITGNTLDGTTFRADEITFGGVTGDKVGAVVIVQNTGVYDTSILLSYLDENTAGSSALFPITPDGGDIVLQWDSDINGIFKF